MTLSSEICTYLYEIARDHNGQNLKTSFNGEDVIILQNFIDADYVLRTNAHNFKKNMAWLRQAIGSSRFTEDGRAWEIRRDISQMYFNKFDRDRAFRSAQRYAHEAVHALISDSEIRATIDDGVLRKLTASILIENFFDFELGETDVNLNYIAELMEIGSSYSFIPKGQTRRLYSDRLSSLPQLRRRVLESLHDFRGRKHNQSPLLRALHVADSSETERVVLEQELISFIAAGTETTCALIGWACYLLARHQDVQDQLRSFATEFWRGGGSDWTALSHNHLMKRFISETLRLYPTSPIVSRYSLGSDRLTDHMIPPEQNIIISFIGIQHDKRYRANPWTLDLSSNHTCEIDGDRIAFSLGPRICGGKQFALLEMMTIVSVFVANARFELTSDVHPRFLWKTQLVAEGGQPVRVVSL